MKKFIFIRDDDVYDKSGNFLFFHDLMKRYQIPVVYSIIPKRLDKNLIKFLKAEKNKSRITLAQHGYSHINYGDFKNKYEFGSGRNYSQQINDIRQGMKIIEENFGKAPKVFVPPYNSYDENTLEAINELGFSAFSSDSIKGAGKFDFIGIPARLCLQYYDKKGNAHFHSIDKILKLLLRVIKTYSLVGIYLHHKDLDEKSKKALSKIFALLSAEKSKLNIEFLNVEDFLKLRKPHSSKIGTLTIELTNRCNLKCRMCSIWKEKPADLDFERIERLLSSNKLKKPISWLTLTGGECFLHPRFNEIFSRIKQLNVREIGISTNGYDTSAIIKFLNENKTHLNKINIDVSIDGLEKNHNFQRGVGGAYEKSISSIRIMRKKFPALSLSVKFTINKYNIDDITPIYKFCKSQGIHFFPKIIEDHTHNYYHREKPDQQIFGFGKKSKKKIIAILSRIVKENSKLVNPEYTSYLISVLEGKNKGNKCLTPTCSLFIDCRGNIFPCIYQSSIANINDGNYEDKLFGDGHQKIIKKAEKRDCRKCFAYHGFLREWNFRAR